MKMQAISKAHQDLRTVSKRTTQLNKLERMRMGLDDEFNDLEEPEQEVQQEFNFDLEYDNLMKSL